MFAKIFLAHPSSVSETYSQHLLFAAHIAAKLFAAGGAALVHALVPCLFEKTASRIVGEVYAKTHNRGQ